MFNINNQFDRQAKDGFLFEELERNLKQAKLVDSRNFDVDPLFAQALKEKLYFKWSESRQRRERFKIKYLTGFAFACSTVILAIFFGFKYALPINKPPAGEQLAPQASVLPINASLALARGEVQTWIDDRWQTAYVGEVFGQERQLRTGPDSRAVLEFDDGSALRIDADSHVIIEEANNQEILILQVIGRTYSRVIKNSGLEYIVETEDIKTKALGTAFTIENFKNEKVEIKTIESRVKVELNGNQDKDYEVGEGQEAVFSLDKNGASIDIKEFGQEELQNDFYIWNREQDAEKNQPLGKLEDIEPPSLEIVNPSNGAVTYDSEMEIVGRTETDADVIINGSRIENLNGLFSKIVSLKNGQNIVEIKAYDPIGNMAYAKISITKKDVAQVKSTDTTEKSPSIQLKALAKDDGIYFYWNVVNLESPKGFKIVKSFEPNPVYPGNEYKYLSDGGSRSYAWKITDGKIYHFRVCQYLGGECGVYSNDITVTAKLIQNIDAQKIILSATPSEKGAYLSWVLENAESPYGFKIVKSAEPNPVYPGDEFYYFTYSYGRQYFWPLNEPGTYHFRICKYNGNGACEFYSNDVSVAMP